MNDNSNRFITAYNNIEKFFQHELNRNGNTPFGSLADHYQQKVGMSARCRIDLKEFAELRNAIIHNYYNDNVIATPLDSTVDRIEAIEHELKNPTLVERKFLKKVFTVNYEDSISKALSILKEHRITQLPVIRNGVIVEMLNSTTIAYWLANNDIVETEEQVSEVLTYREVNDNFQCISPNTNVYTAAKLFLDSYNAIAKGWFLDAVIITDNGRPSGVIRGIIVLEDMARYIEMG